MYALAILLLFEIDWVQIMIWGYLLAVAAAFGWVIWYIVEKRD